MATPAYEGTDFYCDVAIPGARDLDVVHDDTYVLAFHHTRPYWPTHIVVVPKRHLASLTTVTEEDEPDLRALLAVVQRIARAVEHTYGAAGLLTNLGAYQGDCPTNGVSGGWHLSGPELLACGRRR